MRFIVATAFAVALLLPTSDRSQAAGFMTLASDDLSAAKKKSVKRKAAKQEQYLRAVPSTPPPGTKM